MKNIKKVAILGHGKEGRSVHRFLRTSPSYKNAQITILDKKNNPEYLTHLDEYDIVFKTPGIPYALPEIIKARKKGVCFSSATELFFRHAKGIIIGITGTKGKGTTATMLYAILKAAKKDVYLAGNIGAPMLGLLPKLKKTSIIILELSSFQLQYLPYSPHIAVVLPIVPDHLDAHKTFREYVDAKSYIAKNQTKKDIVFYAKGNLSAVRVARKSAGIKKVVDTAKPYGFEKDDVRVPGIHNYENAVMASSVAAYMKCTAGEIKRGIRSFRGLPYHLEYIRSVNGISFYNDSASTNPFATVAAIRTEKESGILIMGGKDKNFSYTVVKKALDESRIKAVIILGENTEKVCKDIAGTVVPLVPVDTLFNAVHKAYKRALAQKAHSVIFSPGAASFDMFENAKERGKQFTTLVRGLKF